MRVSAIEYVTEFGSRESGTPWNLRRSVSMSASAQRKRRTWGTFDVDCMKRMLLGVDQLRLLEHRYPLLINRHWERDTLANLAPANYGIFDATGNCWQNDDFWTLPTGCQQFIAGAANRHTSSSRPLGG